MSALRADDPRQLGTYRLSRRLGQGGQGVVYLGHSEQGAQVAIKLLHASLGDADVRRRFLAEVEAVRRVAAFCTAQLLDADLEGDRPYLVSEYVEGPSLMEHVVASGPRLGGSLERLAIGTATALGAIHRAGVVHRDFKPANVLLGIDGPRVIDFGVARLSEASATTNLMPVGTPAYLSPERIKGEPAGPAADLWAWGLTVVYTATGRHAYTADTYQEILARILYGRPDLGTLTGRLGEIVAACLAPEPGDRPDAEEVLRRLLGQTAAGGDVLSSGALAAVDGAHAAPRHSHPDTGAGEGTEATELSSEGVAAGQGIATPEADTRPSGPETDAGPGGSRTGPEMGVGLGGSEAGVRSGRDAGGPEAGQDREGDPDTAGLRLVIATAPPGPEPGRITDPDPTTSFPAVGRDSTAKQRQKPGRRVRGWQVAVAAALLVAVAGLVFWLRGAQEPGLEGTWTGSAEHFTAQRVFPVELSLGSDGGAMRWGADLHCTGRLGRVEGGTVFTLDRVTGYECYPGTLRMFPTSDANQMAIKVTRQGKDEVTYSGTVARAS
ncbi:protein kinase [Nonomuraea phyllanthi]|uniref:serine/threonine-protein kinase n=1 Tax=Nonomuraea phyllanthi TaxID=2219224 RepID=UPI001292D362|nr:serine/threonine-protein kinase [Nonomuraea phyllanthi]QFY07004.1 protein kinase [Nonomuraea phyllanthi]